MVESYATVSGDRLRAVTELIKHVCMTFSNINLYSWNHPATSAQIQKVWTLLEGILRKHGDIDLVLAGDKMMCENQVLDQKNASVARLARYFERMKVTSLMFATAMTCDDFETFFRIFSSDPKEIREAGGIEEVFNKEEVENVKLNATQYRLVHEDEKVVHGEGEEPEDELDEEERAIVNQFIKDMIQRTGERDELLDKMREQPDRVAQQVAKVLEYADAAFDEDEFDQALQGLQQNLVAAAAAVPAVLRAVPKQQQEMAKAFAKLEGALRQHARGMSSERAQQFVEQMATMIEDCADAARAEALLTEYLEKERSLKAAAELLKKLSSDGKTTQRIMEKLREIMTQRGIDAGELLDLLAKDAESGRGKRKKKRRTSASVVLSRSIRGHINKSGYTIKPGKTEFLGYLDMVLDREFRRAVREETASAREEADEQKGMLDVLHLLLDQVDIGVVLLTPEGVVREAFHGDLVPAFRPGKRIDQELLDAVGHLSDDAVAIYENVQVISATTADDGTASAFLFMPLAD